MKKYILTALTVLIPYAITGMQEEASDRSSSEGWRILVESPQSTESTIFSRSTPPNAPTELPESAFSHSSNTETCYETSANNEPAYAHIAMLLPKQPCAHLKYLVLLASLAFQYSPQRTTNTPHNRDKNPNVDLDDSGYPLVIIDGSPDGD